MNAEEAGAMLAAGMTQAPLAKAQEVVSTSRPARLTLSLVMAELSRGIALGKWERKAENRRFRPRITTPRCGCPQQQGGWIGPPGLPSEFYLLP